MNKQTAAEWLHEQLLKILIDNQIQQTDYLFEQAKAMEKEQMLGCYFAHRDFCSGEVSNDTFNQHYEQAYGGEDKS
jgi:hypothetical protein